MGGPDKSGLNWAQTYVLSATASCIAESATYPFDITKTRLQAAGEAGGAAGAKRGLVGTMFGIVREICPRNRDTRIRVGDHAGKSAAHIDLVEGLMKDPPDFGKVLGVQGSHPSCTTVKARRDLAGMPGAHEPPS